MLVGERGAALLSRAVVLLDEGEVSHAVASVGLCSAAAEAAAAAAGRRNVGRGVLSLAVDVADVSEMVLGPRLPAADAAMLSFPRARRTEDEEGKRRGRRRESKVIRWRKTNRERVRGFSQKALTLYRDALPVSHRKADPNLSYPSNANLSRVCVFMSALCVEDCVLCCVVCTSCPAFHIIKVKDKNRHCSVPTFSHFQPSFSSP